MFQVHTPPRAAATPSQTEILFFELDDEQLGMVSGGLLPVGGWRSSDVSAIPVGGW